MNIKSIQCLSFILYTEIRLNFNLQQQHKNMSTIKASNKEFIKNDSTSENSEYFIEEMSPKQKDYKLIKKCFKDTMLKHYGSRQTTLEVVEIKIYRVNKRNNNEKIEQKSNNLLLFHGTCCKNSVGILNEGFKPSIEGIYGPGVYLTESSFRAVDFSQIKSREELDECFDEHNRKVSFVFVNEILDSDKLKVINAKDKVKVTFTKTPRKNQFEKYIKSGCDKNIKHTYQKDSKERNIKSSKANILEEYNYYVCEEKLVIPRYLIQCSFDIVAHV